MLRQLISSTSPLRLRLMCSVLGVAAVGPFSTQSAEAQTEPKTVAPKTVAPKTLIANPPTTVEAPYARGRRVGRAVAQSVTRVFAEPRSAGEQKHLTPFATLPAVWLSEISDDASSLQQVAIAGRTAAGSSSKGADNSPAFHGSDGDAGSGDSGSPADSGSTVGPTSAASVGDMQAARKLPLSGMKVNEKELDLALRVPEPDHAALKQQMIDDIVRLRARTGGIARLLDDGLEGSPSGTATAGVSSEGDELFRQQIEQQLDSQTVHTARGGMLRLGPAVDESGAAPLNQAGSPDGNRLEIVAPSEPTNEPTSTSVARRRNARPTTAGLEEITDGEANSAMLRDWANKLDEIAQAHEELREYDSSDRLRKLAQDIRIEARRLREGIQSTQDPYSGSYPSSETLPAPPYGDPRSSGQPFYRNSPPTR